MVYFILSKLLSFIINPMFWVILALMVAYAVPKLRKSIIYGLFIAFMVLGNTFITNYFVGQWEKSRYFNPKKINQYQNFVILGGYNEWNDDTQMQDCNEAGDRLFNMLPEILDSQSTVIISGGSGRLRSAKYQEADIAHIYIQRLGADRNIYYENKSRNTLENLQNSKKIADSLGLRNVCVISSAIHIRRVEKLLKKLQIDWAAGGVESSIEREPSVYDLLIPKSKNLTRWEALWHEWIGYLVI